MQIVLANVKGGCGKSTITASLAQVLDADIIDHDNQGTLTVTSNFTGRLKPIKPAEVRRKIVVHDTPPYNAIQMRGYFQVADIVIIPCKVQYPDLLSTKAIVDTLRLLKITDKAVIVFNEIRKPHNKTYREIKQFFFDNYKDIRKAKTELSCLNGYTNVFTQDLSGQALQEIENLVKELNII